MIFSWVGLAEQELVVGQLVRKLSVTRTASEEA